MQEASMNSSISLCMLYAMSCNAFPSGPGNFMPFQHKHKMAALEKVGAINHISSWVSLTTCHTHLIFCLQDGGAAEILSIYEQMSSFNGKHQVYDWTLLTLVLHLIHVNLSFISHASESSCCLQYELSVSLRCMVLTYLVSVLVL